jgi:hypothetical protein
MNNHSPIPEYPEEWEDQFYQIDLFEELDQLEKWELED